MSLLVGGEDGKQVRGGGASKGERSIKGERETTGDIYPGERRGGNALSSLFCAHDQEMSKLYIALL